MTRRRTERKFLLDHILSLTEEQFKTVIIARGLRSGSAEFQKLLDDFRAAKQSVRQQP